MVWLIMCSYELLSRQRLHSTYKLFLFSAAAQHCGLTLQALQYVSAAVNGYQRGANNYMGQFLCGISEMSFLLVLVLMAKGYSITRARLKLSFSVRLTIFMCIYCCMYLALLFYQAKAFDPGEVLYLYESPPGYALIALRICAWFVFAYATFFTVKKFPQKNMFYCPFFICGTLWFYAGPLFILTANSYIDKWVRESVVTAVLLFITFCGHIMFLLLTLPVFANKNFPYHVRTTQIGVMEVAGSGALDNFGHNPYQPGAGAPQTVIIPLTRRTEELIGNMYSQYMAPTPLTLDEHRLPIATILPPPTLNNIPKRIESLSPKNRLEQQDSTDTNTSEDIKPTLSKTETEDETKDVFTIEGQMDKINSEFVGKLSPETSLSLVNGVPSPPEVASPTGSFRDSSRNLPLLRSRRAVLDPLPAGELPQWSLARGPSVVAMMKKRTVEDDDLDSPSHDFLPAGKKVPAVRNGLPSSGEISTIHEGRVPTFSNTVSKATIDLFSVGSRS
ncbi:unnamed protein product [Plutella xylostella]|uniref:(diamondback moth) hypothetical protein n=1 Tax=Plutella xylostella TaxID=51655 RepID=A0A8S4FZU1_PLUXY|nr:unnamed protein product [Plutella xylostella]